MSNPQSISPQERDALLMELKQIEEWMTSAKLRVEYIKKRVVDNLFPQKRIGTNTYELGQGYELKAVVQQRIKINKNEENDFSHLAAMVEKLPEDIRAAILKWTPEISSTVYKSLTKEQQDIVNEVCTVHDYVATLEIKDPKQPTL